MDQNDYYDTRYAQEKAEIDEIIISEMADVAASENWPFDQWEHYVELIKGFRFHNGRPV